MNTIDLTQETLPPGQQLVARDKWPIIGEREPLNSTAPWTLRLSGRIECPQILSLGDLESMPQTTLVMDIHCVTRWSRQKMTFTGVQLSDLIEKVSPASDARFVSFVARSARNHSTSLLIDEACEMKTLIALAVDGEPLPINHGGPIRNIVPGRYFYKSVKWLQEIEFMTEDRLGYWEAESGYHNHADYQREERYLAATIDKRTALGLIESRDFSGKDLRSIDAGNRDLGGLKANRSLLRDASFKNSNLMQADFTDANLSNAHFENSDLRGADFTRADLEGANFSGADLRGAVFEDCSLVGASFFKALPDGSVSAARLDDTNRIADSVLLPLVPSQLEFIRLQLNRKRSD
jgi:DMSO/TMAO reductase YedYZ molybdopterin-dependent catalytic subunit